MPFVKAARLEDLADGFPRAVEAGGREAVLCRVGGSVHAVGARCPHRGGPLAEGTLDGPVLTCPWHGWRFDVRTGRCENDPAFGAGSLAVRVEAGDVYLECDETVHPGRD